MEYSKCEICQEAYFVSEEAKARHQHMCLAVKNYINRAVHAPQRDSQQSSQSSDVAQHSSARQSSADARHSSAEPVQPQRASQQPSQSSDVAQHSSARQSSAHEPRAPSAAGQQSLQQKLYKIQSSEPSTSARGQKRKSLFPPSEPAKRPDIPPPMLRWRVKTGLSSAKDYTFANPDDYYKDSRSFLAAILPAVEDILRRESTAHTLKYNMVLEALYNHPDGISEMFNFKTATKQIFPSMDDLEDILAADGAKIFAEMEDFQKKGSGWGEELPSSLTLKVSRFNFKNPTGRCFTELPKKLTRRKATINVKNSDNKCFYYSVLVKHLTGAHCDSVLDEESFTDLHNVYNFNGLTFPIAVGNISKFEKLNPNTSINVFETGPSCEITPLRVVDEKLDHTDLLLYRDDSGNSHYVYITDFAQLIRPQIAMGRNKIAVCKRCSAHCEIRKCKPDAKTWLSEHVRLCSKFKVTNVSLPKEGENLLKFEEFETQIKVPLIILADFEASLVPIVGTDRSYQTHEPNSFCTLVKSTLPEHMLEEVGISTEPYLRRCNDAGHQFMYHVQDIAARVESLYTRKEPVRPLTDEQNKHFAQAASCELCDRSFNDSTCIKVLDHCHITGEFRHALCSKCNLRCQVPNFIPVYLHNMSRYDGNFILKSLGALPGAEVKVIPSTDDKYIAISVRVGRMWLRILDSYRLMSSGLAQLASILSPSDFVESSKLVPPEYIELIHRKGVYPYDHASSSKVFDETCLPPQDAFYNRLNDEPCRDDEYEFAQEVWTKLDMKTFGDYHDFYLKVDVTLLADVLTSFRQTCLDAYKIDCCHMFTAPGLAYKAMLRMTRVTLELITDADQMLFIESAVRGGLVQCSLRHAVANNKYLSNPDDYRHDLPTSYLLLLDCVNLYGAAQSAPLPCGNFRFVENPEVLDWSSLPADAPTGYILECDVEVPDQVHDRLQDLPLLPEQKVPPPSQGKPSSRKLLATLEGKQKYVAHYTVFQQAVRLGLKITKVHRALSFTQSAFIKKFVDFNAAQRAQSTNEFYRQVYKLMNNSNYGRLLMSKRDQRDVRIATTQLALEKLFRNPMFVEHVIIDTNVVAVYLKKKTVYLNAPIFAGMCVLDISKVHMYRFYYDVLCEHFKASEVTLCYSDTDSCLVHIKTERDLFEVLKEPSIARHLDQSVYPVGHPLRDMTNKAKIGCFKDEAKDGKQIQEYVGLRAKMYAYRYASNEDDAKAVTMKAKGIKTSYVKKFLKFDTYKDTLLKGLVPDNAEYNLIQNRRYRLTSKTVVKKSLSAFDDKRVILDCGIRTLPYGHYRLRAEDSEPTD